eukprot:4724759-Pyramimonas_sp.AAC.1
MPKPRSHGLEICADTSPVVAQQRSLQDPKLVLAPPCARGLDDLIGAHPPNDCNAGECILKCSP